MRTAPCRLMRWQNPDYIPSMPRSVPSSWLKLIERGFTELTHKRIKRGDVCRRSVSWLKVDLAQQTQGLVVMVTRIVGTNNCVFQNTQSGEQESRSVCLQSFVVVPQRPFFVGSPGWVVTKACICDLSSTPSTQALSGGLRWSTTTSTSLPTKCWPSTP